ncbi:methyltransferase [Pseudoteredinibacter isoporae]|uniref:methyltransferase n=1 Tax=Pseudoteredinibacter isoporae TaxID=570281 RepID=UPI0033406819
MNSNYVSLFSNLSVALDTHKAYWQSHAFREPELPWRAQLPDLHAALLALGDESLLELESDAGALQRFTQDYVPGQDALLKMLEGIPSLLRSPDEIPSEMRFFAKHIPGRKWQQIQYFSAHTESRGKRFIDWCCGKGHLGRYMARSRAADVLGLEWDQVLVDEGRDLARDMVEGTMDLQCCDVLSRETVDHLASKDHVLALHACGDLHRQLLTTAVLKPMAAVSIAPCCYQKTRAERYEFLSRQGQEQALALRRQDLHTMVQETVTAPGAVRRRRIQLQQWRLGFDLLQRELRGEDTYMTTPSLPQSVLKLGFKGFCRLLAERRGLSLSAEPDWDHYETLGEQRFAEARRLDVLRLSYRRALEVLVLLDQLLFLQEHGFQAELREFCPRELSPRNLLINAWRD